MTPTNQPPSFFSTALISYGGMDPSPHAPHSRRNSFSTIEMASCSLICRISLFTSFPVPCTFTKPPSGGAAGGPSDFGPHPVPRMANPITNVLNRCAQDIAKFGRSYVRSSVEDNDLTTFRLPEPSTVILHFQIYLLNKPGAEKGTFYFFSGSRGRPRG